jgi:hypothetical protein
LALTFTLEAFFTFTPSASAAATLGAPNAATREEGASVPPSSAPSHSPSSSPPSSASASDATDASVRPHLPRIDVDATYFANPKEGRARLQQAMPALIACFSGKHAGPGSYAAVWLKVSPDGTVTESWSSDNCRGARCRGSAVWLPEGGAKCALKAFQPLSPLPPLASRDGPGAWIEIDVIP